MLWLTIALIAGPDLATPPPPPPVAGAAVSQRPNPRCDAMVRQILSAGDRPGPGTQAGVVMGRALPLAQSGDERVRMYYLLERTIEGCRVPVVAMDRLPDADRARGRNLFRR